MARRDALGGFNPLSFACRQCGSPAGTQCKNYLRKNKQTCPGRGPEEATQPRRRRCAKGMEQRGLFDDLQSSGPY